MDLNNLNSTHDTHPNSHHTHRPHLYTEAIATVGSAHRHGGRELAASEANRRLQAKAQQEDSVVACKTLNNTYEHIPDIKHHHAELVLVVGTLRTKKHVSRIHIVSLIRTHAPCFVRFVKFSPTFSISVSIYTILYIHKLSDYIEFECIRINKTRRNLQTRLKLNRGIIIGERKKRFNHTACRRTPCPNLYRNNEAESTCV